MSKTLICKLSKECPKKRQAAPCVHGWPHESMGRICGKSQCFRWLTPKGNGRTTECVEYMKGE